MGLKEKNKFAMEYIDKLGKQKNELKKRNDDILQAIEDGGYDLSVCSCGRFVVCIPDGLPMCKTCADLELGVN